MDSFTSKSLHEMQGPRPRTGLRVIPEGQMNSVDGPEWCPSVISWGNHLTQEQSAEDYYILVIWGKIKSDDLEPFFLVSTGFYLPLLTWIFPAPN